ncbi:MAG: hypothetical protein N2234_01525, partial [Planctomycetota bacterium]|nr:hypothetical protein [Planctomycetota bacterium]
ILCVTNGSDRTILLSSKDRLSDKTVYCALYQDGVMERLLIFGYEGGRPVTVSARHGRLELDKEADTVYIGLEEVRVNQMSDRFFDVIECDRYILSIPLEMQEHPREQFASFSRLVE